MSALTGGARGEFEDQAREHDLVADALFGGDEQARLLQVRSGPARQAVIGQRNFSGNLEPRGIVAPAVLQVAAQEVKHGAVQPRLGVAAAGSQPGAGAAPDRPTHAAEQAGCRISG